MPKNIIRLIKKVAVITGLLSMAFVPLAQAVVFPIPYNYGPTINIEGQVLGVVSTTFQQGVNGYSGAQDNEIDGSQVSSTAPNTVFSSAATIATNWCNTNCQVGLYRFTNLNITGTITNVQLKLKELSQQATSNYILAAKIVEPDWDTNAVTWNSYKTGSAWAHAGGDYGSPVAQLSAPGAGQWLTIDLGTNFSLTELQQNGIIIYNNIPGWNKVIFYSSDATNAADRPQLVITYDNGGAPDTTPPVISGISSSSVTTSGANISWTTDENSDSQVDYGTTASYGSSSTLNGSLATSHSVSLSGLTSATTYHYAVKSRDASGNLGVSIDQTFTTQSVSSPPPPPPPASPPTISSFTASPSTITNGQSSTLSWAVSNATSLSIDNGVGSVTGLTSKSVSPSVTTTYTLTATNAQGSVTQSAFVTVNAPPPPPSTNLNAHPRIFLDAATLATMKAKAAANDPDWVKIKNWANASLNRKAPTVTIIAATNSNPVQFTTSGPIPFLTTTCDKTQARCIWLGGGTGAWAALNGLQAGNNQSYTITSPSNCTSNCTFTVPIDSTNFGSFAGQNIAVFSNNSANSYMSYDYEGWGWLYEIYPLVVAYQVTGNSAYAKKAIEWLDYANSIFGAGIDAPDSIDSGYPSRTVPVTLSLVYDWCNDQLNWDGNGASRIAATAKSASVIMAYLRSSRPFQALPVAPDSNYASGHLLAGAMLGYALAGDDPNAQSNIDWAANNYNLEFSQAFSQPTIPATGYVGSWTGGLPAGTHYDPGSTIPYYIMYNVIRNTAGDSNYMSQGYMQAFARGVIYDIKPDYWRYRMDGIQTGNVTGIFNPTYVMVLAHAFSQYSTNSSDQALATYLQNILNNLGAPATNTFAADQYGVSTKFIFQWPSRTATNPGAGNLPTAYFAGGLYPRIFWRSDWTPNSDWMMFYPAARSVGGGSGQFSGDTNVAGEIDITRGTDLLIANAQNWFGTGDGTSGKQVYGGVYVGSDLASTLYFYDGGNQGCQTTSEQWGGQRGAGSYPGDPLYKFGPSGAWSYTMGDITQAYVGSCTPANRTLRYWYRTVSAMGNGTYVVADRVLAKQPGFNSHIRWHYNTLGTPTKNGNTVSEVVGSSKIYNTVVLPNAPTINLISDGSDHCNPPGSTLCSSNMREEVSDSAGGAGQTILTVLYATASSNPEPVIVNVSTDSNHIGVQINDTVPKVVVYTVPVTAGANNTYTSSQFNNATFTTNHSGTGNYLVDGMQSGTYDVYNGSTKLTSVSVGSDGTASWSGNSGSYSLVQTGTTPPPPSNNPVISSFTASPSTITSGSSASLSFSVSNATSLTIDNGVGSVTGLTSKSVSPTVTTTYTLTATNSSGSVTATATVTVSAPQPPVISNLVGSNTTASSTTISWNTDHATDGQVDYGLTSSYGSSSAVVNSSPMTTSHTVTLTGLSASTLYHFHVKSKDANNLTTTTADFTFTTSAVAAPPVVPAPTISSFTANPLSITSGSSATLSWTVSGATSLSISNGVGNQTNLSTGSVSVSPATTTSYTLTATGPGGTATQSVTVTVTSVGNPLPPVPTSTPPSITSFTATPNSIPTGQSSVLSFVVTGTPTPTLSIDQGIGTISGTTKSVSPAQTTTYTLTATNSAGSATAQVTVTITTASTPTSTPVGSPPPNGFPGPSIPPVIYIPPTATSTPATTPTTTSGSMIRLVNQSGTYYLIINGTKHGITNPGMLNSYGFRLQDAVTATAQDQTLPDGSLLLPGNGSLVKSKQDPTVYLISQGNRYGFTSASVFLTLGFKFSSVLIVTDPELQALPKSPNLLNNPSAQHLPGLDINRNGTIYWVGDDNQLHGYPDLATYNSWHIKDDFSRVVPANSADLSLTMGVLVGLRVVN